MNSPFKAYTRYNFSICFNLTVMAIFYFITSCAANMEQSSASLDVERMGKAGSYSNTHEIEKRIRDEYRRWKGTRHRLGGTGSRGIDCSGFVSVIYKNLFNIALPRTTKLQVKKGNPYLLRSFRLEIWYFLNLPAIHDMSAFF